MNKIKTERLDDLHNYIIELVAELRKTTDSYFKSHDDLTTTEKFGIISSALTWKIEGVVYTLAIQGGAKTLVPAYIDLIQHRINSGVDQALREMKNVTIN